MGRGRAAGRRPRARSAPVSVVRRADSPQESRLAQRRARVGRNRAPRRRAKHHEDDQLTPGCALTDTGSRLEWISALDKLEALKPRVVVPGHRVPESEDDPANIEKTRQYLRDFNRLDEMTTTARELYDAMLKLHPGRANPGSLWTGANKAKEQRAAAV